MRILRAAVTAALFVLSVGPVLADGKQGENWLNEIDRGTMVLWPESGGERAEITQVPGTDGSDTG